VPGNGIMSATIGAPAGVEPKPLEPAPRRGRVRRTVEGLYAALTRRTAWVDPSPPYDRPTDSQKFRANLILGAIAGLLMSGIAYAAGAYWALELETRRREWAVSSARTEALQRFDEKFPPALLRVYEMAATAARVEQAREHASAQIDRGGAESDEARAAVAQWEKHRDQFLTARQEWVRGGGAAGLCIVLASTCRNQATIDALAGLAASIQKLADCQCASEQEVDHLMSRINAEYDNVMTLILQEF